MLLMVLSLWWQWQGQQQWWHLQVATGQPVQAVWHLMMAQLQQSGHSGVQQVLLVHWVVVVVDGEVEAGTCTQQVAAGSSLGEHQGVEVPVGGWAAAVVVAVALCLQQAAPSMPSASETHPLQSSTWRLPRPKHTQ